MDWKIFEKRRARNEAHLGWGVPALQLCIHVLILQQARGAFHTQRRCCFLEGQYGKMREREGPVGAAQPCRGHAASAAKGAEGPDAFVIPLSCPGTTGIVTSTTEGLAWQHPCASRSTGTGPGSHNMLKAQHIRLVLHPHIPSQSPDPTPEFPPFPSVCRVYLTHQEGPTPTPVHEQSAEPGAHAAQGETVNTHTRGCSHPH